ncbi:MAG: hypothetical protein Q9218_005409 [Villophora microphyllina]
MASPTRSTSFLTLPPEIRNKIYRHLLLASHQPISNARTSTVFLSQECRQTTNDKQIHPTLLSTCRQISREASAILYTGNTFVFKGSEIVTKWLDQIGPDNTALVQDAIINASRPTPKMAELEQVFERYTGLRRLHVHTFMWSCAPPYRIVYTRKFLQRVQPWLLDSHKTLLNRIMSKYNYGFQHKETERGSMPRYRNAIHLTFVASVDDGKPAVGGICFDIEEAIKDVGLETGLICYDLADIGELV